MSDHPSAAEKQKDEALGLLRNARAVFFSMAQEEIRIPRAVPEDFPSPALPPAPEGMSRRLYFAETRLAQREAFRNQHPSEPLALAKLVGAYANKMGVLAEEYVELDYRLNQLKAELAANKAQASPDTSAVERGERAIADIVKRQPEMRKVISDIYRFNALPLMQHVRLRGGKGDIDRILPAQLGEMFKACRALEYAHKGEATRVEIATLEVKELLGWMEHTIASGPKLTHFPSREDEPKSPDFSKLFEAFGREAEHRLKLTFDPSYLSMGERDESEIAYSAALTALREAAEHTGRSHKRLIPKVRQIERMCDLIDDIVKQGSKPVSICLFEGYWETRTVADMLKEKWRGAHGDALDPARIALNRLQDAQMEYLRDMFRRSRPNWLLKQQLNDVRALADDAAKPLTGQQKEQYDAALKILKGLVPDIPADLSHEVKEMTAAYRPFSEAARQFYQPQVIAR